LINSFPDEKQHFNRFKRSEEGTNRSVQDLVDFFDYKNGVEYLSMHFCFIFARGIDSYEPAWQTDPGRVKTKLLELERAWKLYCPIGILLPETFGEQDG
jgi:hypothetical protein